MFESTEPLKPKYAINTLPNAAPTTFDILIEEESIAVACGRCFSDVVSIREDAVDVSKKGEKEYIKKTSINKILNVSLFS